MKIALSIAVTTLLGAPLLQAQAPGVPIENTNSLLQNEPLLEKAKVLREAGKLPLTIAKVKEQLATPIPADVNLPPAATQALGGREVAERARKGYLRIGWHYLCPRCDHWHLNLSGGYAIAPDTAATCHHCVQPGTDMREGYLIAVDHQGNVLPVTAILAKSQTLDAAVLRIEGGQYAPLPLNDNIAPGDAAYCLSEPLGQHGYFSQGIVNRFYWKKGEGSGAENSLEQLKQLRVNVSTDWAPGSSGAAVLDQCGNVIGHVSTISPMREGGRMGGTTDNPPSPAPEKSAEPKPAPAEKKAPVAKRDRFDGATLITLHEAIPARGVRALVAMKPAPIEPPIQKTEAPKASETPVPKRPAGKREPIDARVDHDRYPAPVAIPTANPPETSAPAPAAGTATPAAPVAPAKPVEAEKPTPVMVTLSVGSPAPALTPGEWVQGEPVKEFARDKVYLVEFWATWCGPCRQTIPHLNEIHRKYVDKGLVVIGQDCLEQDREKVAPFLKTMGDKMTYRVAMDSQSEKPNEGSMFKTWMRAAGQGGIPTAFLVDKQGTVAWIGHPMQLKEADIEALLAGKFDIAKAKVEFEETALARKLMNSQAGDILKALRAKNWDEAESAIVKLEEALPKTRKQDSDNFRLQLAIGRQDQAAVLKIVNRVTDGGNAEPLMCLRVALALSNADLPSFDWALAEKLGQRGLPGVPKEQQFFALDILARIQFRAGKKEEAVKTLEAALAAAPEAGKKNLQTTLDAYKAGSLPGAAKPAAAAEKPAPAQ